MLVENCLELPVSYVAYELGPRCEPNAISPSPVGERLVLSSSALTRITAL